MNRTCQDAEKPKARDMDVGMARSMGKLHETAAATPFGAGNSIAAQRGTGHCGLRAWAAAAFACFFGKAPRGQLGGRDGAGGGAFRARARDKKAPEGGRRAEVLPSKSAMRRSIGQRRAGKPPPPSQPPPTHPNTHPTLACPQAFVRPRARRRCRFGAPGKNAPYGRMDAWLPSGNPRFHITHTFDSKSTGAWLAPSRQIHAQ